MNHEPKSNSPLIAALKAQRERAWNSYFRWSAKMRLTVNKVNLHDYIINRDYAAAQARHADGEINVLLGIDRMNSMEIEYKFTL